MKIEPFATFASLAVAVTSLETRTISNAAAQVTHSISPAAVELIGKNSFDKLKYWQ